MIRYFKTLALPVLACLFLGACGEGGQLEKKFTDTVFPYGNQRTAGTGVAYVLAKMMPEKTLKLTQVKRDIRPVAVDSSVVQQDLSKSFVKELKK